MGKLNECPDISDLKFVPIHCPLNKKNMTKEDIKAFPRKDRRFMYKTVNEFMYRKRLAESTLDDLEFEGVEIGFDTFVDVVRLHLSLFKIKATLAQIKETYLFNVSPRKAALFIKYYGTN